MSIVTRGSHDRTARTRTGRQCATPPGQPGRSGGWRLIGRHFNQFPALGLERVDMNVVVVESPAKAKTINKYLGDDYTVIASYGHVRDLPAKDGSVKPDQEFAMEWEVDGRALPRIAAIAKAVKGASKLYLATDPDREGEAISWHVYQCLNERKVLKGVEVKRVVFNEVTKGAVLEAFAHPREINQELVDAYLARRALDYLVGFTLSPVLWRKLPGSRSAGRVAKPRSRSSRARNIGASRRPSGPPRAAASSPA
jgi:reverse gyrase